MREGAQGGAPSDIQVAPVAQQIGGTNSLSWKFIGIPRKPSYSASFFPPTIFWPNSHLVHGYPPSLLILPGLLRSDRVGGGGLSASSPSGEWEDACSLRRW